MYVDDVSLKWSSPMASSQHMIWCGRMVPRRKARMSRSSMDSVSDGGPSAHVERIAIVMVMSDGLTPLCMQNESSHWRLNPETLRTSNLWSWGIDMCSPFLWRLTVM